VIHQFTLTSVRGKSIEQMKLRSQKGFTLIELLVATGLSLVVLASVATFFRAQTKTVKGQESRMEANDYVLTVLDLIVREIRNTGYFPSTACDTTGGIASASTTGFNLQYDKNSDGACSGDDEVIAFAYDSTNNNVTRNGQALTDGNATALQFNYYPQQTSSTLPTPYCVSTGVPSGCSGTLSANYKSVQKITVSLTVAPKSADSAFTGAPVSLSLTADLRNHGT
jgi:prepilin-type N-terminal cleavage/methylation domain-containing protein